jgi:hypothetical protein
MVDKFHDPLLSPKDVARHLRIPPSTLYHWLADSVDGEPLVHSVEPERRGWPSVPFVAVVEAYVLRSLRELNLTKAKIRLAAVEVRKGYLHYIDWDRGAPVVLATKVPVDAIVDLWLAGEPLETVAYEYDLTRDQVEAICRATRAAA